MDTVSQLYQKYIRSLSSDIEMGCIATSETTQELLAFYQEVQFRLSPSVNDQVTANQLLTYTSINYR